MAGEFLHGPNKRAQCPNVQYNAGAVLVRRGGIERAVCNIRPCTMHTYMTSVVLTHSNIFDLDAWRQSFFRRLYFTAVRSELGGRELGVNWIRTRITNKTLSAIVRPLSLFPGGHALHSDLAAPAGSPAPARTGNARATGWGNRCPCLPCVALPPQHPKSVNIPLTLHTLAPLRYHLQLPPGGGALNRALNGRTKSKQKIGCRGMRHGEES